MYGKYNLCTFKNKEYKMHYSYAFHLKGHRSISIFSSLIPIHLLTTRLATLKHSATVAREARVQAQEVGVINIVRFSHGDSDWGYLVVRYPKNNLKILKLWLYIIRLSPCI